MNWKYTARWIVFVPAGLMAGAIVRVISYLLQEFMEWRNPPDEFGDNFIEGGVIYLIFGTITGRTILFILWRFISESAAIWFTIICMITVVPSSKIRVMTASCWIFGLIYLSGLVYNLTVLRFSINIYEVVSECFGALLVILFLLYNKRNIKLND